MLSILIPTTPKTKQYLDFCVASLERNTTIPFEILVGENGQGTEYLQGQCAAVNRLAREAKGDWFLISNDDMYYPPTWADNIRYVSECMSLNANFTWDAVAGLNNPVLKAGDTIETFNREMADDCWPDPIIENGFLFPIIVSKRLWELVGGYDEMYDPWSSNSDSDLEYKVILAGVQPKILRGVFVYHFGMKSGTFDPDQQVYWKKNWDYFVEKWGFPRVDTPFIQKADVQIDIQKLKYHPEWSVYKGVPK